MDKKYTSLESTIKNVVRGNTGAAQDNRSLESKIRSVVLKEEKVARNNIGDRVEINMPGAAAHGQSGILKSVDEDGMARVHLNPNMGATGTQTKMGSGDQTISGLHVRMGGTHTYVPLSRLKLFYPDNLDEEGSINEAPDDAAPPGENHLSVHELFGYLRDYNEDHDRSTDPDDPDEESAKESRSDINSTEEMIGKIHGQDTLDHVRNAIESERHIRLGTNPGVNNHQAVKAHLDAAVRASRHFSEALGTGGNEGGEFKGTPPAFFKPFHVEPKVGDTHPPSEGAAAASRNRAKIASSETMKKEGYVITPSGRKPLINEAELEEGSEKFAKIMARTAAKRGEPITTDTTELEKKHNELLQAHQDALAHAEQTKKDYEDLLRKYGSVQEDTLEEGYSIPKFQIPPGLANLFRGGGKSVPKASTTSRGAKSVAGKGKGRFGVAPGLSKLATTAEVLAVADQLLGGGSAASATTPTGAAAGAGDSGDISNLTVNRHYAKGRVYHGPEIHYNEYEPAGDYIGEDSAEKADAERTAIENVGRPNSKNKLAKQGEIQRKIIENTQRRKAVILRAKEENKSGKDGANPDIETKPDLKHADINEVAGAAAAGAAAKGLGRALPGLGLALGTYDAYDRIKKGDYVGAGISGLSGIAGLFPGLGTAASLGLVGANLARDYKRGEFDDKQDAGASTPPETIPNSVAPAASSGSVGGTAAGKNITQPPKIGSVGGTAAGKALNQSYKPGSVGGTAAGKAMVPKATAPKAEPKPKPTPKPALKLPGPETPGYRTVAQMNDYEAKRAELLNKYPNSAGAKSAGNRSVEAATKSLNTNKPVAAPQPSSEINRTNTETPRSMGSSWNNSYKNKYSMGPGPSQFPSK